MAEKWAKEASVCRIFEKGEIVGNTDIPVEEIKELAVVQLA